MKHIRTTTVKHGGGSVMLRVCFPLALETCRVWKSRWIHWSIRKS